MKNELIIVRGGGDLATGTIYKLYKCGYRVLVLETESKIYIKSQACRNGCLSAGTPS